MATDQTNAMTTAENATKNEEPPKLNKDYAERNDCLFSRGHCCNRKPLRERTLYLASKRFSRHQSAILSDLEDNGALPHKLKYESLSVRMDLI